MTDHEAGIERMKEAARKRPVLVLAAALETLDKMTKLDDAHRLTRAVLTDVICEKSPEADAAFQEWAESDNTSAHDANAAIIAAVRKAARRPREG